MGWHNSEAGTIHILNEHVHSAAEVTPSGEAGKTLTCGSGSPWDLGTPVEVIATGDTTKDFDIHFIDVEAMSADAVYEIILYNDTTEIGRKKIASIGIPATAVFNSVPIQTPIQPAGSVINAAVRSDSGNADTLVVSFSHHPY